MRLIKFLIGLVVIMISFAIFWLASAPRDFTPALRPYIVSETAEYVHGTDKSGSESIYKISTIELQPMIFDRAAKLGSAAGRAEVVASMTPVTSDWFTSHPGQTPLVSKIRITAPLSWNEAFWLKIAHPGAVTSRRIKV